MTAKKQRKSNRKKVLNHTMTIPVLESLPALSVPPANSSLTKIKPLRIGIVGGSIGGLAAAACLQQAGFNDITVLERATEHRAGAGIGLDDASVGILKGLGLELTVATTTTTTTTTRSEKEDASTNRITVQSMRWTEERILNPNAPNDDKPVTLQQPYPYSAVLYSELAQGLEAAVTKGSTNHNDHRGVATTIQRGSKVVDIIHPNTTTHPSNGLTVSVEDVTSTPPESKSLEFDLVIVADGPRSRFRHHFSNNHNPQEDDLRFSGYTAWRGTVPENDLPAIVVQQLRSAYPDLSNCLYFVWGPPGKSAVLYDIGQGLVNWLIYEVCEVPKAPPGRTTTTATAADIAALQTSARDSWGDALGAVIEHTPTPFQNDIYDIREPLVSMHKSLDNTSSDSSNSGEQPKMCILGDAAHPISPHCAKGSNLAIHDAYVLACAAQHASSLEEMLQRYSQQRVKDCRNTVLLSRHLGRLRNNMPLLNINGKSAMTPTKLPRPKTSDEIEAQVKLGGLPTVTLPMESSVFDPIWKFTNETVPVASRGFCLDTTAPPTTPLPSLDIIQVNHMSLETVNVDRLVVFYQNILGLPSLSRPDFGFGGAWLQLPSGMALHIIEQDPEKPGSIKQNDDITNSQQQPAVPERFIRRSRHVALTVPDIEAAKSTLRTHGIEYAVNKVPDTPIQQLFLYDPDGNGIEIGNFGLV